MWEAAEGQEKQDSTQGHGKGWGTGVDKAVFVEGGTKIVSKGNKKTLLWNSESGQPLAGAEEYSSELSKWMSGDGGTRLGIVKKVAGLTTVPPPGIGIALC